VSDFVAFTYQTRIWLSTARAATLAGDKKMTIGTIILIILVLLLVGAIPAWPYSRSWGYGPSGIVGVIVVVLLILFAMGRL
jgi:hypothetical protein